MTSAAVVATCALVFTVASFWWLNARRGRLRTFEPHTFAMVIAPRIVRLRLPLVLYNSGAIPIVVQGIRIRFVDHLMGEPLGWVGKRSQIRPTSNENHDFPAVFAVSGRSAEQIFAEFGIDSLGFALEARDYRVYLEGRLGHRKNWVRIGDFTLRAGHVAEPSAYITYDNTPGSLSEEQRRAADSALKALAEGQTKLPSAPDA